MLIRIAPDMFIDERFDCVTVQEVCEEIFRTQKFKTKYPWRTSYKDKIRPYGVLRNTGENYALHLDVVRQTVDSGQTSLKTGRSFGFLLLLRTGIRIGEGIEYFPAMVTFLLCRLALGGA